jgi:hypothetical protein
MRHPAQEDIEIRALLDLVHIPNEPQH